MYVPFADLPLKNQQNQQKMLRNQMMILQKDKKNTKKN